jgi:hypothetical protein
MWSTCASLVPIFLEALLEGAWLVRGNLPLHARRWSNSPTHTTDACCFSAAVLLVVQLIEVLAGFSCILTPFLRRNGCQSMKSSSPEPSALAENSMDRDALSPHFQHPLRAQSLTLHILYMLRLVVVHAFT